MKPVSCVTKAGKGSYGGSQMWWKDKVLVNSGCGIIAGLEVMLNIDGVEEIDRDEYLEKMDEMSKIIRPLRLPFKGEPVKVFGRTYMGSLGVMFPVLVHGLKKIIKKRGLNYKVRTYQLNFEERTRALIERNIPVILLIRAPFKNVPMYDKDGKSIDFSLGQHYVTVTDYDEEQEMFVISSWGDKYKIDPTDLRKFSVGALFCYAEPI